MTATLGNSLNRRIKEQIRDRISACASVAVVYTYDKLPFKEWPAVFLKYTSMDGEFVTTAENRRTYSYSVKVLVPIGKSFADVADDRLQFAEEAVGQVVEEIMNTLDTNFELGQFNANVLYVRALDVLYTEYSYEGGYAKGAELTIQVATDYDV